MRKILIVFIICIIPFFSFGKSRLSSVNFRVLEESLQDHPLHLAVFQNDLEKVKSFVDRRMSVNLEKENWTPLALAIVQRNWKIVKFLVENEADPNKGSRYKPLNIAAKLGELDLIQFLVEHYEAYIDVKDKDGITPLHEAASSGHLEVIEYLLNGGVPVNIKDREGFTPLMYLIKNGHPEEAEGLDNDVYEAFQYFIEKKADIKVVSDSKSTLLHFAVKSDYLIDIAQFLIEQDLDVNAKDKKGRTPLHLVERGSEVAYLLISEGADVKAQDDNQETPLHYYAIKNNMRSIETLLEEGADVNAQNKQGQTPLYKAVFFSNSLGVISHLIDEGADLEVRDGSQNSIFVAAVLNNDLDVVEILIQAGADVNAQDVYGRTPLDYALEEEDKEEEDFSNMIELLEKHGAESNSLWKKANSLWNSLFN